MTIGKLLFILGIILILYTLISGIHFYYNSSDGNSTSSFSYSLNFGKIIAGALLIYLGNRLKK